VWKKNKNSKGEVRIAEYLKDHQINFNKEFEFKDLKNPKTGQRLRLDFWIPSLKVAIEFDGQQHFEYCPDFHGKNKIKGILNFREQVFKDCIKDLYCTYKKIKLIRISYLKYQKIEEILNKELDGFTTRND